MAIYIGKKRSLHAVQFVLPSNRIEKANLGNYIKKTLLLTEMLFKIANRGSEMLGNVKTVSSLAAVINPLHVCVMIQFFSYIAV